MKWNVLFVFGFVCLGLIVSVMVFEKGEPEDIRQFVNLTSYEEYTAFKSTIAPVNYSAKVSAKIFIKDLSTYEVGGNIEENISFGRAITPIWVEIIIPKNIEDDVLQFDEKTKGIKLNVNSTSKISKVLCSREKSNTKCLILLGPSTENIIITFRYTFHFSHIQTTLFTRFVSPEYIYIKENRAAFPVYLVLPTVERIPISLKLSMSSWRDKKVFLISKEGLSWYIFPVTQGKEITWEYYPNSPITLFVGRFKEVKDEINGTLVYIYFPPDKIPTEKIREVMEWTKKVVKKYQALFQVHPFKEYTIVYWPSKGKMGGNGFKNGLIVADLSNGTIAHEMAHAWFYNYASFGLLDESLATFSALYVFNDSRNYRTMEKVILENELSKTISIASIMSNLPEYHIATILYYKGAFVFRSLQFVLGNETFFEGLRELLRECHDKECNLTDVQNVFEKVSGQNLDWFFREWFYTAKVPDYEVGNLNLVQKSGRYSLTFEIIDKNNFTMPLEVEVITPKEKLVKKVWIKKKAKISFELKDKPLKIILDPNEWMVNKNEKYNVGGIEIIIE